LTNLLAGSVFKKGQLVMLWGNSKVEITKGKNLSCSN